MKRLPPLLLALLVAAMAVAVVTGRIGPRGVRFVSEEVVFRVDEPGPSLVVDGRYRLRNTGLLPVSMAIRFPFGSGGRAVVQSVELDERPVAFHTDDGEARFTLPLRAGATSTLRAVYRQQLAARTAGYVVTTVRDWGRPLEEARFRIELPKGCDLTEATPPLDRTVREGLARSFWPAQDLAFSWTCAAAE